MKGDFDFRPDTSLRREGGGSEMHAFDVVMSARSSRVVLSVKTQKWDNIRREEQAEFLVPCLFSV